MISPAERLRRDRAIAILRAFLAGKLTNREFENRYDKNLESGPVREWEDRTLWALKSVVWSWYDDLSIHRLDGKRKPTPEQKQFIARSILFLRSSRTYEWKRYTFFPFGTFVEWITLSWRIRRLAARPRERIDWEIWPFRRADDWESAKRGLLPADPEGENERR
ncbi:MAG: hypothetical protein V4773_20435 [Verrucomicrobiota bacterium]